MYAMLLTGETVVCKTPAACWSLTLLLNCMIARRALTNERRQRAAIEEAAVRLPARARHRAELGQSQTVAEDHLIRLEKIVVRQHGFVSDVAHELRSPLTAQSLVGENVLAKEMVSDAQLRAAIASMLEESRYMKRLIEGLLDLTRASLTSAADQSASGQRTMLDLSAVARDCVESLRILAEEKQQSIEVSALTPLWAAANLTMVRQALLNVIDNAIEHCPEGTHIRVETVRSSPEEGLILVQDDGPGLPAGEQHHLFERFYRGSRTSRSRSLGLGLSIAKAALCSQGGGIALKHRPGAGCCFILTLPLAPRKCVNTTVTAFHDRPLMTHEAA
jgi:signal transduction histidine kinase